jgi:16S rRNA A1518/A1519 N6-dimethyltransferase RsmA/KsgA/DIM1 with predicted DNA glycosylase/AP lyase activity
VHLALRDPRAPSPEQLGRLDRLVARLFQQRRKSLASILARTLGGEGARERGLAVCADLGLEPLRRPEELALEELQALADDPRLAGLPAGPTGPA